MSTKKRRKIDYSKYASTIQRAYRRYARGLVNYQDLELERFTAGSKIFRHVVAQDRVYRFIPQQLSHYFMTSGLFQNPYTNQPFNDIELSRLTRQICQQQPSFACNFSSQRDRSMIRRCALEQCNLEHNIQMHQDRVEELLNRVYSISASLAISMMPSMMQTCLSLWEPIVKSLFEELYVLYRLSPCSSSSLVSEFSSTMIWLASETTFTATFRKFLNKLSRCIVDTHNSFYNVGQGEMPNILFQENILQDTE